MKIEKITEKIELNVCAQGSDSKDCLHDCLVWKAASDYLYHMMGVNSHCYQGYSSRWSTWW